MFANEFESSNLSESSWSLQLFSNLNNLIVNIYSPNARFMHKSYIYSNNLSIKYILVYDFANFIIFFIAISGNGFIVSRHMRRNFLIHKQDDDYVHKYDGFYVVSYVPGYRFGYNARHIVIYFERNFRLCIDLSLKQFSKMYLPHHGECLIDFRAAQIERNNYLQVWMEHHWNYDLQHKGSNS